MSKALLSIGVIQVLVILVNMGRAKVLSIMLGPAGFGIVSTIDQVVLSLVQLGGFAVPFIALKFMSHAHSESHEKFQIAYSSFLSGVLALSLLSTSLLIAVLAWQPDLLGEDLVAYSEYLHLALFAVPSLMLGIFFMNTLAAAQRSAGSAYLSFAVTLALALAACMGVWLGGIKGLYMATVGTGLITSLATLIFVGRSLQLDVLHSSAGIIKELRRKPEIISMALILHIALSAYSVALLIVRFYVFSDGGEVQAGFFQALLSIALALGAISGPMNALYLTPLLNRALPLEEKLNAAHEFLRNITLVLTVVALPILLFPKLAIFTLFSSEFISVSKVVYLFILWQCLYQMVNVYQQLLIGLDDTTFFTISTTAGYLLTIALCPVLIANYELEGAALSLIGGILVTCLLTAWRLKTRFNSAIPRGTLLRVALCLSGTIVTGILLNRVEEWSLTGMGVRLVYAVIYTAALWLLLNQTQKQFVLGLRHKLPF